MASSSEFTGTKRTESFDHPSLSRVQQLSRQNRRENRADPMIQLESVFDCADSVAVEISNLDILDDEEISFDDELPEALDDDFTYDSYANDSYGIVVTKMQKSPMVLDETHRLKCTRQRIEVDPSASPAFRLQRRSSISAGIGGFMTEPEKLLKRRPIMERRGSTGVLKDINEAGPVVAMGNMGTVASSFTSRAA